MTQRTVLVTGAGGLLGHAVLAQLKGVHHIVGVDVLAPSDPVEGVRMLDADLRDTARLVEIVRAERVTDIVHAGAISHPLLLADEPGTVVAINVLGTQNLLEAARVAHVKRLVFISSSAVYGAASASTVLDERSPLRPDSIYGASKAAAEMLVTGYHARFGVETVILRPVSIYGPRRRTFSVPSYLVANALDHLPSRIHGTPALDLIYVDDVARAITLALDTTSGVGRTYTIASGTQTTYAQIAAAVQRLIPNSHIEVETGADEPSEEGRFYVDAAQHDLRFHADCDLDHGLQCVVAALRTRPDLRAQARAGRALLALE